MDETFIEPITANWVSLVAALVSTIAALSASSQRRQAMRISWNRELISWAREAMTALSEAQMEAARIIGLPREQSEALVARIKAKLSAAVDHGRLFYENKYGIRREVLDPLICVITLLEKDPSNYGVEGLTRIIDIHRTNYWRRVQRLVDPKWMRKTTQGLTPQAGSGDFDFDKPRPDPIS